ncbi:hypothetical protein CA267_001865 [Alteromonas pelagimontana]|uniref:Uncharacterized protein n=1 Tax=Alteromonas pelagimontana TaxID=1858656 RepID=A0A6M4MAD5_9ALTE|nr:hypothetical protein [Alteromonas pelagimontana]QJR79630.1 hypothetical protein CA267_001865 [Alteromonas pelagimontana]
MKPHLEAIIDFSNGRWVSVEDAKQHLSHRKALSQTIQQMGYGDECIVELSMSKGLITRYRAFRTKGMTVIEIAKYRKSLGIVTAPESYPWRKSA